MIFAPFLIERGIHGRMDLPGRWVSFSRQNLELTLFLLYTLFHIFFKIKLAIFLTFSPPFILLILT